MPEGKGAVYEAKYGNSWALIIGINDYKKASPLSYAINDAKEVAKILEERFKFPQQNIFLLTDKNATADLIRKKFLSFVDEGKIKPDDRLLVFFAGHGYTALGKRGEVGFLVPSDGDLDDISTLVRWDELTRNADLIPAKHILFLMDACYGGLMLQRHPSFGSMRFLGDMLKRYARQVLTAGKADETVADGNGVRPGHSIFTAHLLEALEGGASTKEGIISASGVMAYVYERVAKDQFSSQTPHYGFFDGDGDFIFDTSLLDEIQKEDNPEGGPERVLDEREGEKDILINTSPQVIDMSEKEITVADTMKELLSDSSLRIKLDDFISLHIRYFLEAIDLRNFPTQGAQLTKEEFVERVKQYEDATSDLKQIVILLAKWGDTEQLQLIKKIFVRVAEADKGTSGLNVWLHLNWYPLHLLMYYAGITALSVGKYEVLRIIFQTSVQEDPATDREPKPMAVVLGTHLTSLHDQFKWLPGQDNKYVPRSEHLFKLLQPTLEDMLFLGRSYETLFDQFEVMWALSFADLSYTDVSGHIWGPPGRFGWKHERGYGVSPLTQTIEQGRKEGEEWGPIKAGLFQHSISRFLELGHAFDELVKKWSFW